VDDPGRTPLRRDADENRRRILDAARATFAESGPNASLEGIAKLAGVGIATLYRRFPTRETLLAAVFEQHLDQLADMIESDADSQDDPWDAFAAFVWKFAETSASERGLSGEMSLQVCNDGHLDRHRYVGLCSALIERAQEAGDLRDDVSFTDVGWLIFSIGLFIESTASTGPGYWRRYVAFVLDALRAPGVTPLPPVPLGHGEVHAGLPRRWQTEHLGRAR
jgi:AcrR family transcriptional regulator